MRPTQSAHATARSAQESGRSRLISLLLLGVAGCALWLAVPRFAAGLAIAPHGDTLSALDVASTATAERAERGYRRAHVWQDSPQIDTNFGALALAASRREALAGNAEAANQRLAQSAELHRAGLALSPLQPYAWTRLAQTDIARDAPRGEAVAALRMALDSGPWEPALVIPRIALAFAVWNDLDADLRARMVGQIRHAAQIYPLALARLASQRRAQDKVLGAIEDDTDLLRRFSQAYSRI